MDKEKTEQKVSVLSYNDELKSLKLKNLQTQKIKDTLTNQLDTVAIPLGQHLNRFDKNKNGLIDLYENPQTRYLVEDLPTIKDTMSMIGHVEDYLVMKEKEVSLLVESIKELFIISDSAVSNPMSIPVLAKEDGFKETLAFEKRIRNHATKFANASRIDDKHTNRIVAAEICDTNDKKFIANKVWFELTGEYLFKDITTEKDFEETPMEEAQNGS